MSYVVQRCLLWETSEWVDDDVRIVGGYMYICVCWQETDVRTSRLCWRRCTLCSCAITTTSRTTFSASIRSTPTSSSIRYIRTCTYQLRSSTSCKSDCRLERKLAVQFVVRRLTLRPVNVIMDELLWFQNARRILIAVYQNTVYKEYLPPLLGTRIMKAFNLNVNRRRYFSRKSQYM